jgi:ABC-type transport system involved in multi-copper enzyme maturation permease subunit
MSLSPFAILVLDRDPLQWADLSEMVREWVQVVGGLAFFGLIALVIVRGYQYLTVKDGPPGLPPMLLVAVLGLAISAGCFGVGRGLQMVEWSNAPPPDPKMQREEFIRNDKLPTAAAKAQSGAGWWADLLMTAGGAAALIGFGVPFGRDLFRLRLQRIGALARLSFKEAVRRRVIWAPLVILLVFLFPPKWFFLQDPKDEVSTYISVIYWAMTPIMLLILSLLGAFAIPTDIRNQTIHTVVTKPVERFEIVLGRTLGYLGLATVILAGLSGVSILLLWASQPSEEAQYESYKARVPVYGKLEFLNVRKPTEQFEGESVGREWEYRRYIAGGHQSPHRAVWNFDGESDIRALADRPDAVPCEFAFDIFRTTKGDENKGVTCTFQFVALPWGDPNRPDVRKVQDYQEAKRGLKTFAKPGDRDWEKFDALAEKFGYYEYPSKEVFDFHTLNVDVPKGLFRAALRDRPAGSTAQPRLMVIVKCESPTQFLGVAKRDLYFLAGDEPFWLNFFKGVFGLWLRLALVISVAVACSTYLSGVIAWLVVGFLYGTGLCQDFIAKEAAGVSVGGGPFESAIRLVKNQNIVTPLQESAEKSLALTGDAAYQWLLRRVMDILPDVERFSWSNYVAAGFSIPWAEIVINTLVLAGYLLPWAVLAYYLMKSREVAA